MAEVTVARVSALASNYPIGRQGKEGAVGVQFSERKNLQLSQVAAWPDTLGSVAAKLANGAAVPGYGQSVPVGDAAAVLLRTEPLKFWLLDALPPPFDASEAVSVDLSHSRTVVRLQGSNAVTVLNSYLPLDLREAAFPVGSVASTAFHHVGVTLWRSPDHYELFLPRGFALSLWELLLESAQQHGCEVA